MSRHQEINNIKSTKDEINFLVKHHPELKNHTRDLERLISNLIEIVLKYEPRLTSYRRRTSFQFAKEKARKLSNMEKKAAQVDAQIAKQIAARRQQAEDNMPTPNQGNQKQEAMRFIAREIKSFWTGTLEHEKFFYDDGNKHEDWATPFVDDLSMVILKKQKTTGLKAALSEIADSRKVK